MRSRIGGEPHRYKRRTHVRPRPLHWFIILISYLFILLLILESVAFIVLGAWFLSIPRLNNVLSFSDEIYRRELGFGILLVVLGSFGIFISILGIIATILLRISILRIVSREEFQRNKSEITMHLVCGLSWAFDASGYWCWNCWRSLLMYVAEGDLISR